MTTTTEQTESTTADMVAALTVIAGELIAIGAHSPYQMEIRKSYGESSPAHVDVFLDDAADLDRAQQVLPGFGEVCLSTTSVAIHAEREIGGQRVTVRLWVAPGSYAEMSAS